MYYSEKEYTNNIELKIKQNNKWFPKLTIAEGRKPYHGMNGILTNYHIQFNPNLGICKIFIRRINYACIDFRNDMDLTWDY